MRPIAVDLFAGAGGLSLGFEQAGFDVVAAVEIDPIHAAIHKFNFPNCAVIARSVTEISGADIRAAAGIGEKAVDVVIGGPPCQGFSLIGHRAFDDDRNALVRQFVRLVKELNAKHFVFENVRGLTIGKHRRFLEELIGEFDTLGYDVRMPWRVLNAADHGTPQNRQRLFLMGAKRNLALPAYPLPRFPTPSCAAALEDIPDAEMFDELINGDEAPHVKWGVPSEYAREMRCLSNAAWHFGYVRNWSPEVLTSSARTGHSEISRRRFAQTAPGDVEPISRFFKLAPNGISNTLRAGTDAARGAFTSPRPVHYRFDRCVTVREMARLHGFPDWFRFHETKWHGARQIGNSVPPPLGRAVATSVMEALDIQPRRPHAPIDLGDPTLIRISMQAAADSFGVSAPVGKRDRKSGAHKRSQLEIEIARMAAE